MGPKTRRGKQERAARSGRPSRSLSLVSFRGAVPACARVQRPRLEPEADAQRVNKLPLVERVVRVVAVVKEKLVLGQQRDERRVVDEVLDARLGTGGERLLDALAVHV